MRGGIGNALMSENGVTVAALSVVNALGNVVSDGTVIAGNRDGRGGFVRELPADLGHQQRLHTTNVVVVTDANLGPRQNYTMLARYATIGLKAAIDPLTQLDGDTVYATSIHDGNEHHVPHDLTTVYTLAPLVVAKSIVNACLQATSLPHTDAYQGIIPSSSDYSGR
jgi:L-aminopeptidase/D-esterase-like protein